jgi:hypothetical protein
VHGLAALAVAVTLVVAGCTDDSSPKPSPLPSATESSSSAAPTPSAPAMPTVAKGVNSRSAEAFARHYVDLINYAMHSGDTAVIRELSTERCQTCEAIAGAIDRVYEKSGHLEGDGWRVLSAAPAVSTSGKTARVSMQIRINKQVAYSTPHASPSASRPQIGNLDFGLARSHNAWVTDELRAIE